jgi:hypothetical protein
MRLIILCSFLSIGFYANAQKLDSLFFNLYTDSLKKGTYNYINVDGRFSDGRWLPLTSKELNFYCDAGKFDGNSLFIDQNIAREKVTVRVALKSDTSITREKVIYIKKREENEPLKTVEEVMKKRKSI